MYSSFLAHQHEKNVYSAVFYFRPPAGQTDSGYYEYGDEVMGGLRLKYNVIRMYELEGESFLDPSAVWVTSVHAVDAATFGDDFSSLGRDVYRGDKSRPGRFSDAGYIIICALRFWSVSASV